MMTTSYPGEELLHENSDEKKKPTAPIEEEVRRLCHATAKNPKLLNETTQHFIKIINMNDE